MLQSLTKLCVILFDLSSVLCYNGDIDKIREDRMKNQSVEGDKYLSNQYKRELDKERRMLDENEKKKQNYKKQAKIMAKAQGFSILGIFGSLIAIVVLLTSSQIIIPIFVGIGFLAATILTSIEKNNDEQLILLIDSYINEIQERIDYLENEIEKLQKKMDKKQKESAKNNKAEKVQTFLLYTVKPKQLDEQVLEENVEEDTIQQENYVS